MAPRRLGLLMAVALAAAVLASVGGCGRGRGKPAAPAGGPPAPLTDRTVHVLCYHSIVPSARNTYETSVADFKAQMQVLKSGGFQAITTRDLADHLDGVRDLPSKPVLITFDDGYKTVLTVARPILDRLGFRANLFAITGSVGGKGALSWDELKQLAQAGYEIGSHTANHSVLTRRGARESAAQHQARIPREIAGSYQKLEEKLGAPPVALAYPYGNYDAAGMRACQAAGYRLAFSIDPGPLDRQSSPWNLPRTMVVKGTSERAFRRFLATEPLHLSQLEPPVGERLAGRAYRLTGRVGDPDALSSLGVEAGKQTRLQVDPATSRLTLTTTLRRGANLVRLTSAGTPRREAGWIVVSDR